MKYLWMKDEETKNALSFGGSFSIGCEKLKMLSCTLFYNS
jgi:hypothetical protein